MTTDVATKTGTGAPARPPLVVITGASSGIGEALARHYLARGWRCALLARHVDAIEAWCADAPGGARATAWRADVRDVPALQAACAAIVAAEGLPDVVIANAGISVGMDTEVAADVDVMRRTLETNVLGVAATFQPFLGAMRERGAGTLVAVASVAGIRGLPGHGAYCASKAGVIAYAESLRGECRAQGVRVVTVVPGYIDTPLTRRNRYPMPFLMAPSAFAAAAVRAIDAGASYRVIPWPMGIVAKLLRLLPNALFDRVLAGRPRKRRENE